MGNYLVNQETLKQQVEIVGSFCPDAEINTNIGYSNTVMQAKTEEGIFVFRFCKDAIARSLLEKEIYVCEQIQDKVSFSIPKIRLAKQDGQVFTIHKFIEGETLNRLNQEGLSERQYMNFCRDLVTFIQEMRRIRADSLDEQYQTGIFSQIEGMLGRYRIPKNKELFGLVKDMEKQDFHLIHGDLNANNILLKKDGHISGIIDFNMTGLSNYCFDLSKLAGYLDNEQNEILLKEFNRRTGENISLDLLEKIRLMRCAQEKAIIERNLQQQNQNNKNRISILNKDNQHSL